MSTHRDEGRLIVHQLQVERDKKEDGKEGDAEAKRLYEDADNVPRKEHSHRQDRHGGRFKLP
jgi:hypothetical protein